MASSTDSSVFVDAFPTISSHPSGAKTELQITVPRFGEADSAPMAGLVRIPELVPHRDSGPMICLICQWLEKNKLQSLKSQRKSHVAVVALQLLSHVQIFKTPATAARQAPLSFTISQSLLKLMSIESVMPSNHLVLICKLLAKTKATSA